MRRLPSDVSVSLEVKAARGLTRVVFAECRPAFGDRPLYCAEGETPAQALLAFARDCNVPLTLGEADEVLRDGAACQLWAVEGGVVVVAALPPSVVEGRKERRAQGRGARGGMSPAEKQARYRSEKAARERAAREASPATAAKALAFTGGASPLPPANDSVQVETLPPPPIDTPETGGSPPPSDLADASRTRVSLSLLDSNAEREIPDPERGRDPLPSTDWSGLPPLDLAGAVMEGLASAGAAWSAVATRWELESLGALLLAQSPPLGPSEVTEWAAWLSGFEWRKSFHWTNKGAGLGPEDPLTVKILLGSYDREKRVHNGSGLNILRTTGVAAVRKRATKNASTPTVQALRAAPVGKLARVEDLALVRDALKRGGEVRDA